MNNIRKIRRDKDITQDLLAELLNSTRSYISGLERGVINNPSLVYARKIAKALSSTIDEVFPEKSKSSKSKSMDEIVENHIDKTRL